MASTPSSSPRSDAGGEQHILDSLGRELLAITAPLSACMLIVALLVWVLPPSSGLVGDAGIRSLFSLYYSEQGADSVTTKLSGALINALGIVVGVTAVTCVLYLLHHHKLSGVLWLYSGVASLCLFLGLANLVLLPLLQMAEVQLDKITYYIMLWNFASVGVLTSLCWRAPTLLKHSQLVVLAALCAYWFTFIPPWTTWLILLSLVAYDVAAALSPPPPPPPASHAPLPSLVFEAGPFYYRVPPSQHLGVGSSAGGSVVDSDSDEDGDDPGATIGSTIGHSRQWQRSHQVNRRSSSESRYSDQGLSLPLLAHVNEDASDSEMSRSPRHWFVYNNAGDDDDLTVVMPASIKLGLGDFIFYAVLVGRAATYDMMACVACYLGVVAGLGLTLCHLCVHKHARTALPAMPLSMLLGTAFYMATRLLLERLVVPLTGHLLML